jgi:hypothetical protein
MMEYWNIGRKACWEGGRIDRRTAIRRPSQSQYSPSFQHSSVKLQAGYSNKKPNKHRVFIGVKMVAGEGHDPPTRGL